MPLEFIAGARGADFIDRANVVEQYHPPEFDIAVFEVSPDVDGYDWAVLTLDRPIGETVGWLDVAPLTRDELDDWVADGSTVVQAGYSADALGFLSAHPGCPIVEIWDDNTFYHECDILFGDAGSPLFMETAGGYRVVGVQSATYLNDTGGYDYNMAVDARSFWPELSTLLTDSQDGTATEPAVPEEELTDKERK
jgi:protease YdgD